MVARKSQNFWNAIICCVLAGQVTQTAAQNKMDPSRAGSNANAIANANAKATTPADDDNIIKKPKETADPVAIEFTEADRTKVCQKYNGKLLSVSGEMWKVISCVRHQVHDPDLLFQMSRSGTPVIEVDSRDLAPLAVGSSWETLQSSRLRPCSTFQKRYVTLSYTDIYYVENCVKRLVPDYETLLQHRKERGAMSQEIIALTDVEFYALKQGRDLSSVVDKEFSKLLDGSAGVDIIPIDEACKGVDGKLVSFYSRIYKVEKCHKREINAETFTMKNRGRELHLIELKPDQWLSMPDGKPMND